MGPSKKELPSCEWEEVTRKRLAADGPDRHQDIAAAPGEGQLRALCRVLENTMVSGQKPAAAPQVRFPSQISW